MELVIWIFGYGLVLEFVRWNFGRYRFAGWVRLDGFRVAAFGFWFVGLPASFGVGLSCGVWGWHKIAFLPILGSGRGFLSGCWHSWDFPFTDLV